MRYPANRRLRVAALVAVVAVVAVIIVGAGQREFTTYRPTTPTV